MQPYICFFSLCRLNTLMLVLPSQTHTTSEPPKARSMAQITASAGSTLSWTLQWELRRHWRTSIWQVCVNLCVKNIQTSSQCAVIYFACITLDAFVSQARMCFCAVSPVPSPELSLAALPFSSETSIWIPSPWQRGQHLLIPSWKGSNCLTPFSWESASCST